MNIKSIYSNKNLKTGDIVLLTDHCIMQLRKNSPNEEFSQVVKITYALEFCFVAPGDTYDYKDIEKQLTEESDPEYYL